jgi:anaerobic ribonucleoside-triphosphate reductase
MKEEKTQKVKVVPCEVYSRVVGYFRPVQNWNKGKQQEFNERKTVRLDGSLKVKFFSVGNH